jgi:hypothetical protein
MGTQPSPYWRLPHVGIIKNPGVISSWRCLYILSRVWVSNWIMICGGFAYEILHNYIPIVRLGRAVRPYKCCFLIAQRLQINKEKAWTMRWRWWPDPYRLRPKSPRGPLFKSTAGQDDQARWWPSRWVSLRWYLEDESEGSKKQQEQHFTQKPTKFLLHLPHAGFQHAGPKRGWLEASPTVFPFPALYSVYFDPTHCPDSRGC